MSSGRSRRTGAGPPCRCTWEKNSSVPGSSTRGPPPQSRRAHPAGSSGWPAASTSSPTAPSPTIATVLWGPAWAATAPNQPVPSTSEAASKLATRSSAEISTLGPSQHRPEPAAAAAPIGPHVQVVADPDDHRSQGVPANRGTLRDSLPASSHRKLRTMASRNDVRAELRQFLTTRRASSPPQQAGVPSYGRKRRGPGCVRRRWRCWRASRSSTRRASNAGALAVSRRRSWRRSPGRCNWTRSSTPTLSTWSGGPTQPARPSTCWISTSDQSPAVTANPDH
jgi:hypothetical protein